MRRQGSRLFARRWGAGLMAGVLAAIPAAAQGVRDHTRPDAPREATATVSESQANELTLTVIDVAPRPLQTWVRAAGSLDATRRVLVATVPAADAVLVQPGQRARVFPPQSKSLMTQARVSRVTPRPDGSAVVELALPVAPSYDAPLYVVEIVTERGTFLAVSNEAIIEEGEQHVVYVEQGPGRYVPREIETGLRGELFTEVVDGLAEGDRVVTFGSFFIDAEYKLKLAQ